MDVLLNTIDQVRIVLLRALIFKFIDLLRISIETQVLRILSEVFGVWRIKWLFLCWSVNKLGFMWGFRSCFRVNILNFWISRLRSTHKIFLNKLNFVQILILRPVSCEWANILLKVNLLLSIRVKLAYHSIFGRQCLQLIVVSLFGVLFVLIYSVLINRWLFWFEFVLNLAVNKVGLELFQLIWVWLKVLDNFSQRFKEFLLFAWTLRDFC